SDPHSLLITTKTVLAVWPADAQVSLNILEPGASLEVKLDDAPWMHVAAKEPAPRIFQSALIQGPRYASADGGLFVNLGKGWQRMETQTGVRASYLLSSTDLDGDGRPEVLVYARWANDYGLDLFANDELKPLYSFSCGNI